MSPTTVICVLRSGGDFDHGHVARLALQVRAHSPEGTPFICLTDQPERVGHWCAQPLRHGWPGWWSKVEALAVPGPCLYLDLDVSIIGDLGPLLALAGEVDFAMSAGFWGAEDPNPRNSSVMMWRADGPAHLHDLFSAAPEVFMRKHTKMPGARTRWGDQGFIAENYGADIPAIQDLLPGMVASFKRDALRGADLAACRALVSHGRPRPWDGDGADNWLRKVGLGR